MSSSSSQLVGRRAVYRGSGKTSGVGTERTGGAGDIGRVDVGGDAGIVDLRADASSSQPVGSGVGSSGGARSTTRPPKIEANAHFCQFVTKLQYLCDCGVVFFLMAMTLCDSVGLMSLFNGHVEYYMYFVSINLIKRMCYFMTGLILRFMCP